MTNDLEDFAQWRGAIEARVGTLEAKVDEQAFAIRRQEGLRAAMDEDVSKVQVEFRAQRGLLQALHDTQSDHTRRLSGLENGQEELKARLTSVEGRLTTVEGTLQKVHVGVQAIHDKLDRLIDETN